MPTFVNGISSSSFKTRPTILQVIPAVKNGGVEIEALEIGKAIVAAGGKALIAARLETPNKKMTLDGIEFINLPLDTKNPLQILKNAKLLTKLIEQENVDIVHARSRAPAWSAYKTTRLLQIPFVTTYHAAYSSKTPLKTLYNSVMARGDRVIAISQFIQDHLIQKYQKCSWFDLSKFRLIQRGIDFQEFDPSTISDERLQKLRESWTLPSPIRVLLLPGRMSRTKGHTHLLQALALLKNKNVVVVCIGSAQGHESYRDNLLESARKLNLEQRIIVMPPCPDIAAAYALADIIVCPSLVPEGFGRLIVEAQAMEKPIVAFSHGAVPGIIHQDQAAWLVPPGNIERLAQTLDAVLDSPKAEIEAAGKKARAHVKALFSKELMCSQTIDVYQEFLNT